MQRTFLANLKTEDTYLIKVVVGGVAKSESKGRYPTNSSNSKKYGTKQNYVFVNFSRTASDLQQQQRTPASNLPSLFVAGASLTSISVRAVFENLQSATLQRNNVWHH